MNQSTQIKTLPQNIFKCTFAQRKKFVMIYMYGFPAAIERTSYCNKQHFHYFSGQQEMEMDIYRKMLNNQRVLFRIAQKNARRTLPQAWLRHKLFGRQPMHLSDLGYYRKLAAILAKWQTRQLITPKNQINGLFALQALKY